MDKVVLKLQGRLTRSQMMRKGLLCGMMQPRADSCSTDIIDFILSRTCTQLKHTQRGEGPSAQPHVNVAEHGCPMSYDTGMAVMPVLHLHEGGLQLAVLVHRGRVRDARPDLTATPTTASGTSSLDIRPTCQNGPMLRPS